VRLLCGLAASALLLAGCSGGSQGAHVADPDGEGSGTAAPSVSTSPLLRGLDVCSLASPALVRRTVDQVGEPTSRTLTRIDGYAGLVDQCGFGVSFDSYTFVVSVGLAPARRTDLARVGGEPVDGVGDAARAADRTGVSMVTFLKGRTLVQVTAVKPSPEASRLEAVTKAAGAIARTVPVDPPESDAQTTGKCAAVLPRAVQDVLGAPSAVSRTLLYKDQSAVCSWATGVDDPRTVSLSIYTNRQAGPFIADQKSFRPTTPVRGVRGDAFTIPGVAYVVADDGQVVSVGGSFPPRAPKGKPLPVTPQLTALLASGEALLQ
jgi:hypothetical protein